MLAAVQQPKTASSGGQSGQHGGSVMYRKPLMLAIALIAAFFGLVLSPTSAKSAERVQLAHIRG
jgi:hypothetical protein